MKESRARSQQVAKFYLARYRTSEVQPPPPPTFPYVTSGFSPPHHSHYSLTPANEKSLAVDGIAKLSLHFPRGEKARIYVHAASKIPTAIDRGPLSEINGPAPLRHFGPGIKFKARAPPNAPPPSPCLGHRGSSIPRILPARWN